MPLQNICDDESELCKEIFDLLNRIISDYKSNILKKKTTTDNDILTHSGSAPILGWIGNRLSTVNISEAIHKMAISSHKHAEQHYRDNYVWHAWLRNNSEYFTFKHDISEQTGLPILNNIKHLSRYHNFKTDSLSYYHDEISDIHRFQKAFHEFNNKYPIIGQIHRCLIIIRFFNESLADEHIVQDMELQKIYYPLFYFVNLFIHIGMLYYSFGIANYGAIIKRPIFATLLRIDDYEDYININEDDYHLGTMDSASFRSTHGSTGTIAKKKARSIARFNMMKDKLQGILDKSYAIITKIYPKIKELVNTNVSEIEPIDNLDKVYFDAPLSAGRASAMAGPASARASAMAGPASARASAMAGPASARASAPRATAARSPPSARARARASAPSVSAKERARIAALTRVRSIISARNSAIAKSPPIASAASVSSFTPRSKKKSNLKIMGFNELVINKAINNNPDMSINRLIDVIPNYQLLGTQERQDSPTPHPNSDGYGQLFSGASASGASGARNNESNLSRDYIISILASFGITASNTSFITENMGIILDNLLSKIPGYRTDILSVDEKMQIADMYETMLYDYISDSDFEEDDISHTSMNIVKRILIDKGLIIPDERSQRTIFTINALVKEILNILVRN